MGTGPSTEKTKERVQHACSSVLDTFSDKFIVCWQSVVLDAVLERHGIADPYQDRPRTQFRLSKPPNDALKEPLKCGWLFKMGEHHRTWRRRWFVAVGADAGFNVRYYSNRDDEASLRGEIALDGYFVDAFTDQEVATYGPFGLKLSYPGRRTWLLRADDEGELSAWIDVFLNASRSASTYSTCDTKIRAAFILALRCTMTSLGFAGTPNCEGSEIEALVQLVDDVLQADISPHTMRNLGIDADASMALSLSSRVRGELVTQATATWQHCQRRIRPLQGPLVQGLEVLVPELVETQRTLYQVVLDELREPISPSLYQWRLPLKQVFALLVSPLQEASAQTIIAVAKMTHPILHRLANPEDDGAGALITSLTRSLLRYSGPLRGAYAAMESLEPKFATAADLITGSSSEYIGDAAAVWAARDWLADASTSYLARRRFADDCVYLAQSALHNVAQMLANGESTPDHAFRSTLEMLAHDCCVRFEKTTFELMDSIATELLPPDLVLSALELAHPVSLQAVPPHLRPFVDVPKAVHTVMRHLLLDMAAGFMSPVWATMRSSASELAISPSVHNRPTAPSLYRHWQVTPTGARRRRAKRGATRRVLALERERSIDSLVPPQHVLTATVGAHAPSRQLGQLRRRSAEAISTRPCSYGGHTTAMVAAARAVRRRRSQSLSDIDIHMAAQQALEPPTSATTGTMPQSPSGLFRMSEGSEDRVVL